jgi:hypothetical protein
MLSAAVREAMLKIKIKKRRPPTKAPTMQFIKELATLYENHTGKHTGITQTPDEYSYSGRFFNFVYTCLSAAGDSIFFGKRIHSNGALGKQIQRALKDR